MKKFLFVLLLFAQTQLFADNINSIFNDFKDCRKAEYVSISPFLMRLGKMFMSDKDKGIEDKIKSMKVLDLEDCSRSVKEKFNKSIVNLDKNEYETLMSAKDENDNVQILIKEKKDIIKELIIVCGGEEDCALILIKGDFKHEDIKELVEQETESLHGDE